MQQALLHKNKIDISDNLRQLLAGTIDRVISTSVSFTTYMMIAHLGEAEVAALPYISTLDTLSTVGSTATMSVVGGILSRIYKMNIPNKADTIKQLIRSSQCLGLLISLPVMIMLYSSYYMLKVFSVPENICKACFNFFVFRSASYMFSITRSPSQQLFMGTEHKLFAVLTNLTLSSAQIFFTYVLIFGEFGFSKLGIMAPGLVFLIRNIINLLINEFKLNLIGYFGFYQDYLNSKNNRFTRKSFIWTKAWPVGLQYTLEMASIFIVSVMTGYLGVASLKIRAVTSQSTLFIAPLIFSLSQSTSYVVARAAGVADDGVLCVESIRNCAHVGIASGVLITGSLLALMIAGTDWYVKLFNGDAYSFSQEDKTDMRYIILMAVSAQVSDSVRNISSGVTKALTNTRFSSALSIVSRLVVKLLLSYILGFVMQYGLIGFSAANLIDLTLGASCMYFYMRYSTSSDHWAMQEAPNDDDNSFFGEVLQEARGCCRFFCCAGRAHEEDGAGEALLPQSMV